MMANRGPAIAFYNTAVVGYRYGTKMYEIIYVYNYEMN